MAEATVSQEAREAARAFWNSYVAGWQEVGAQQKALIQAFARFEQSILSRQSEREKRLEEALRAIHAARLRRDGSDPGYGWSITKLNKAMNAALPLLGLEPPQWDGKLADLAEPAERMARTMGCSFEIDPAKVAAGPNRAALTQQKEEE